MLFDYHVHTNCSHDAFYTPREQLEAAAKLGITELCFTDHIDFDTPNAHIIMPPADLTYLKQQLLGIYPEYKGITVKIGAEISLGNAECARLAGEYIAPHDLDFTIGSVHTVQGVDTYYHEYFAGKTKQDAYFAYLQTIFDSITHCDFMCVLGHYDFVAKYAPFEERKMTLSVSKELFEGIFDNLIKRGKGIEINTSAWGNDPSWGLDILKLYRELGGEYVTIGSDAHKPERVGRRLLEAVTLARTAGIRYVATFDKMVPQFHSVEELEI